jgi:hypothetical protein
LVQFFLGLARTGVRATVSSISGLRARFTSVASASSVPARRRTSRALRALTRDISVNVFGGGLGDIAAVTAATTTAATTLVVGSGAQAAAITGTLDTFKEAGLWLLHAVEWVTLPAAGDEGKTNWLALGIGTVKLLDRGVCILQAGICDVSDTLGASGAVV